MSEILLDDYRVNEEVPTPMRMGPLERPIQIAVSGEGELFVLTSMGRIYVEAFTGGWSEIAFMEE